MNLFENLQMIKEVSLNNKTLDDIAEEIENKFYDKFKAKFGTENELHACMLFSATKYISDEYFSKGYDIKLTVTYPCLIPNNFREFIKSFADEFNFDIYNVSSSQIDILIKVDNL